MPASSRRAVVDKDGNEVVTPGCFTRRVVACPCTIAWISFGVALFACIVGPSSGRIKVNPVADAGYDTPQLPEQVTYYAWWQTYDSRYMPPASAVSNTTTAYTHSLFFLYQALPRGSNILRPEVISGIESFERVLLRDTGWPTHCSFAANRLNPQATPTCKSPVTILRYVYVNDALHESQCRAGYCDVLEFQFAQSVRSGAPFTPSLAYCETVGTWGIFPCTSTVYDWRDGTLGDASTWASEVTRRLCSVPQLQMTQILLLDSDATCANGTVSTEYARSSYNVETAQYENGRDFAEAHDVFADDLIEKLDDAQTAQSATPAGAGEMSYGGKPLNIWWMCGAHPALGWCDHDGSRIMRLYLQTDISLAQFSMMLIAVLVFANTGSALLTLAGLFEILASLPIAMFFWMILGQTHVSTLMLLGLFVVLCIGADDIFVFMDTWKESAVMPPSISGSMETRFAWTWNRASNAMLATTSTTFFCLALNGMSKFPNLRVFGIFNAFVILADYILVITWFAASVIGLEWLAQKQCPPGNRFEFSCCCNGVADKKERAATAFFKNTLAPAIQQLRWVLLLTSTAIVTVGIVLTAANFEEGETMWFHKEHTSSIGAAVFTDEFQPPGNFRFANVVLYGLQDSAAEYPTSMNQFQRQNDGYYESFRLRVDGSFTFGPTEQQKIVDDCDVLRANTQNVVDGEAYCVLNELQRSNPAAFPYADEAALLTALEAFYVSEYYAQLRNNYTDYTDYTGFVADGSGGVSAVYNAFNSTMPLGVEVKPTTLAEYYDPWKAAIDAQCTSAVPCQLANFGPPGPPGGRAVFFYWMATLRELGREAMMNIAIALVISYLVLVAVTRNVLVPGLAILSIGSTVTCTLATTLILGHKMDANAAILIVMATGMSVDYAVHLAHFYNDMPGTRYEKVRGALHGVGLSVCGGGLTTGGAAIPLCFAQHFQFFKMAGDFILSTAIFGIFFSFTMLMPLLVVAGPEGTQGDVDVIFEKLCGKRKMSRTADDGDVPMSSANETSTTVAPSVASS